MLHNDERHPLVIGAPVASPSGINEESRPAVFDSDYRVLRLQEDERKKMGVPFLKVAYEFMLASATTIAFSQIFPGLPYSSSPENHPSSVSAVCTMTTVAGVAMLQRPFDAAFRYHRPMEIAKRDWLKYSASAILGVVLAFGASEAEQIMSRMENVNEVSIVDLNRYHAIATAKYSFYGFLAFKFMDLICSPSAPWVVVTKKPYLLLEAGERFMMMAIDMAMVEAFLYFVRVYNQDLAKDPQTIIDAALISDLLMRSFHQLAYVPRPVGALIPEEQSRRSLMPRFQEEEPSCGELGKAIFKKGLSLTIFYGLAYWISQGYMTHVRHCDEKQLLQHCPQETVSDRMALEAVCLSMAVMLEFVCMQVLPQTVKKLNGFGLFDCCAPKRKSPTLQPYGTMNMGLDNTPDSATIGRRINRRGGGTSVP